MSIVKAASKTGLGLIELFSYYSGLVWLLRKTQGRKLGILMYHRIKDKGDGFLPYSTGLYVHPETFAEQMRYLRTRYSIISFKDLLDHLEKGKPLPKNPIIITFDDGFLDNYQEAYPVLKELGIPSTLFVVGCTLDGKMIWLHEFYRLEQELDQQELLRRFAKEDGRLLNKGSSRELLQALKTEMTKDECDKVIRKIFKERVADTKKSLYVNESQLKKMEGTMDVGSHSFGHHILSTLRRDEMEKDIGDAKRMLKKATGQDIVAFAYPFGNKETYSKEVIEILRKHHRCAVTTEEGLIDTGDRPIDLYRLKRLSVVEGSNYTFAATLVGIRAGMINILRKFIR